MPSTQIHLLLVDPQNDFCDLPDRYRPEDPAKPAPARLAPALPVPGAHADMQRLAALVERCGSRLSDITVTLDTHLRLDIAHPDFWMMPDGALASPFTQIRADDVRSGRLLPRDSSATPRVLQYLDALAASGRHQHMIWPVHCEVGTWGHAVHADLHAACARWESRSLRHVGWVNKGINPWTEHFSAIRAEIPDREDPTTQTNQGLLARLRQADRLLIAGEAGSHCVKATTEHIVEACTPEARARIVLLSDGMSPVAGFEANQQAFLEDMTAAGLRVTTTAAMSEELLHD